MQTTNELVREENRRIRLIRISSDLLVHVLMTRPVSQLEAEKMISGLKELVLKLFPGKEHVFDLIYLPRFRRAFREAVESLCKSQSLILLPLLPAYLIVHFSKGIDRE